MLVSRPLLTVFLEKRPKGGICDSVYMFLLHVLFIRNSFQSNLNVGEQTPAHCFSGERVFLAKSVYIGVDFCYMCNLAEI